MNVYLACKPYSTDSVIVTKVEICNNRYAFGLEESGDCRKAEEIARQALDLNPDLPWAIHALGHVYEETRPPEEGIEHMTTWKLHWIDSILSVHMTWHLCLFYLGESQFVIIIFVLSVATKGYFRLWRSGCCAGRI